MASFITVIHVVTCVLLVLVVLLQSGKGAEISASFSGSSQTLFGSGGGANFFTKLTTGLAILFMCTSVGLTILTAQKQKSIFETNPKTTTSEAVKTEAKDVENNAAPIADKDAVTEKATQANAKSAQAAQSAKATAGTQSANSAKGARGAQAKKAPAKKTDK